MQEQMQVCLMLPQKLLGRIIPDPFYAIHVIKQPHFDLLQPVLPNRRVSQDFRATTPRTLTTPQHFSAFHYRITTGSTLFPPYSNPPPRQQAHTTPLRPLPPPRQ